MSHIPTKNNFHREFLYKRFAVKGIVDGEVMSFRDIFEAADYIKTNRCTKASRSAIRRGIFKSSNPAAKRNKYLGTQWITVGVNIFDDEGKWKESETLTVHYTKAKKNQKKEKIKEK